MKILVTGGSGVLGRAVIPLLGEEHEIIAPSRAELDLFDPSAVSDAVHGTDAVYHLATRIPLPDRMPEPQAWLDNDRLRTDATRILVDAALAAHPSVFVQPTVAFVYPTGRVDELTRIGEVAPRLRSALDAEEQALRFAASGRTGIVLRLGLLYGPGTCTPRDTRYGATLHSVDAGRALAVALKAPSGIYNVVEDDGRVANVRFKKVTGWHPRC